MSEAVTAAGSTADAQLSKYKRLLTMARSSLEANQASLAKKDAEIEDLQKSLSEASKISKQEKRRRGMGMLSESDNSSSSQLLPRNILCRVDVDDYVWILVEYDSQQLADGSLQKVEDGWSRFNNEDEMTEYLSGLGGVPLSVPSRCLSSEESKKIEEEAEKTVSKVVNEFRSFKVKSEIARKQKDAEVSQIILKSSSLAAGTSLAGNNSSSTLANGIENALLKSTQSFRDTGYGQSTMEELQMLKSQLQSCEENWKVSYEKVVKENEMLRNRGGDILMASQWRGRYDDLLREKNELVDKLRVFNIHLDHTKDSSTRDKDALGHRARSGDSSSKSINTTASDLRAMALNPSPYSPSFRGAKDSGEHTDNLSSNNNDSDRSQVKSIEQLYIELKDEFKDYKRRSNSLEQQRCGELDELRRNLARHEVGVWYYF